MVETIQTRTVPSTGMKTRMRCAPALRRKQFSFVRLKSSSPASVRSKIRKESVQTFGSSGKMGELMVTSGYGLLQGKLLSQGSTAKDREETSKKKKDVSGWHARVETTRLKKPSKKAVLKSFKHCMAGRTGSCTRSSTAGSIAAVRKPRP